MKTNMIKKDIVNKIGLRIICAIEHNRIMIPPHTRMLPSIMIRRIKDVPMSALEDTLNSMKKINQCMVEIIHMDKVTAPHLATLLAGRVRLKILYDERKFCAINMTEITSHAIILSLINIVRIPAA